MDNGYLDEIIETIKSKSKLIPRGGLTKTGIQYLQDVDRLDVSVLSGIKEYHPSEYTFTAFAGTRLKEINQVLSENRQFLPFDPPMAAQGATLGGTVAANLSGPMRYHYGGVRDFILGVKFLNDQGQLIRTGGKVVKNAAGFDIPKLMVGTLGSLGTLVEISFKVFPRPEEYITLIARYGNISDALNKLIELASSQAEILCLDLHPQVDTYHVLVRLGGNPDLFDDRITTLEKLLPDVIYLRGAEESKYWEKIKEFLWVPEGADLIKVPIIPKLVPELDGFLQKNGMTRHYSAGANVAWIAWSGSPVALDRKLKEFLLIGLKILGSADQVHLGAWEQSVFYKKIKAALDPSGLWAEV